MRDLLPDQVAHIPAPPPSQPKEVPAKSPKGGKLAPAATEGSAPAAEEGQVPEADPEANVANGGREESALAQGSDAREVQQGDGNKKEAGEIADSSLVDPT